VVEVWVWYFLDYVFIKWVLFVELVEVVGCDFELLIYFCGVIIVIV